MKTRTYLGVVLLAVAAAGCGEKEEETCVPVVLQTSFDVDTILPKGCYLALETPDIASGVRLTFDPGVQITFSPGTGLTISGDQVLDAAGTEELPILLTGEQKTRGSWKGLEFEGATDPDNRLEWVTVEYGGDTTSDSDAAGIKAIGDSRGVTLSLDHVTVQECQGWGLYLTGSADTPVFAHNTFTANTLGPANVDSEVAGLLDAASSYTGNGVDRVNVRAYGLNRNGTWAAIDVPYFIDSNLGVAIPWTIEAGNTLIMAAGVQISLEDEAAALLAIGTAAAPILFTGDQQTRGYWTGISLGTGLASGHQLEYVTVEYAGDTAHDFDGAGVKAIADSRGVDLGLKHTTIRECLGWGLYLTGSARVLEFEHNTFTANGLGPVSVGSEAVWQLDTTSSYAGNDTDQVRVRDSYISTTCTWQDLGVPYLAQSRLTVNGNSANPVVWTLAPGVTLILPQAAIISVASDYCGFTARGTAERPITITGAEQAQGYWKSISFDGTNNSANAIEHAIIEYGGSVGGSGEMGMIQARADSHGVTVSVTNSVIQHSGLWGIWFGGSASGDIETGNTFLDNASGDIFRE